MPSQCLTAKLPLVCEFREKFGIKFTVALHLTTLLCVALLLSPVSAVAQSAFGSITGSVTDAQHAAIVGAKVTVTNEDTGTQQSATTDQHGEFVFPALLPATYTVEAEKAGFAKLEKTGATLTASATLTMGVLQLKVGSETTNVTVSAEGTPVETTSSEVSATVSKEEIAALPSLGRDYMAFTRILPGSSYIGEGNTSQGLQSSGATFNGISGTGTGAGTYVSTNGVYSSFQESSSDTSATDLDTVQDIHVLVANYDAEYGRVSGSVINITTRSGSSKFNGGVYYYFRNEDLNANDYFAKRNDQARSRYRFNTAGGTIGGPVLLPGRFRPLSTKLFFFSNYDSEPSTSPNGPRTYLMPTALERQGDFSQSFLPGTTTHYTVMDPQTHQQFPGNVVPAGLIDPMMQKVLGVFPLPNFTNTAVSNGYYNYVINDSSKTPTDRFSLRFDYTPAPKWQIYGRWQRSYAGQTSRTGPGILAGWQSGEDSYDNLDQRFEFGATYTIRPNLVNQASGGFTTNHEYLADSPSDYSQFLSQNVIGGAFPNPYPSQNPLGLLPGMSFNNGTGWTYEPRFPLNDRQHGWSVSDAITDVVGNHQLKFGAYVDTASSYQPHHTGQWGNAGSGDFSFNAPNPNNPNNVGNAYAEGLLGYFDTYTTATNRVDLNMVERNLEAFGQDSWRVTRKLTVNYGLRFTYDIPVKNENQYGSQIDFSKYSAADAPPLFQPIVVNGQPMTQNPMTGAIEPAAYLGYFIPGVGNPAPGSVSVGNRSLADSKGVLVAPRFGIAYDPFGDGKTAIRGAFGQFFSPRTRWGTVYGDVTNAPTVFYPTQYYGKVEQIASTSGLLNPSNVQYLDRKGPLPLSYQWSFGIQRELGFKTVLNTQYVANVQRHGQYQFNLNEVPYGAEFQAKNQNPTTGTPLPDIYFTPYPGYSSISDIEFGDNSNYHSLQVTLTRQFSKNLTFDAAYTWSKALDDNKGNTYVPVSITYGPVYGSNRPNRFTTDWVWNAPKIDHIWNNFVSRAVFNNWAFSGIASFITGAANNANCGASNGENITGGGDGYRCIKTGSAVLSKGARTFDRYFNTSVFSLPAVGQIGNQWNTSFYGPGVNNWDFSLMKKIPIGERVTSQLRVDMFNAFNHTQFSSVNTSGTFDPATGAQLNGAFGQLNGDSGPRVVQLSTRLNF